MFTTCDVILYNFFIFYRFFLTDNLSIVYVFLLGFNILLKIIYTACQIQIRVRIYIDTGNYLIIRHTKYLGNEFREVILLNFTVISTNFRKNNKINSIVGEAF